MIAVDVLITLRHASSHFIRSRRKLPQEALLVSPQHISEVSLRSDSQSQFHIQNAHTAHPQPKNNHTDKTPGRRALRKRSL